MSKDARDSRYYQVSRPGTLAERMVVSARKMIYRDFLRIARPTRIQHDPGCGRVRRD